MITLPADRLTALVADIFAAAGYATEEAAQISKSLVGANLAGHDSHGVVRVPRYLAWKADGSFVAGRTVRLVSETAVTAVVDAEYGFGQWTAPQAVRIGIAKAQNMGLALVAMRNSGHIGRVGEWAEMAAEADLISIHYVNAASSLLVAPYGGVSRRLSTAPHTIGIPRAGDDPLILDFATSIVAEGKVLVASQGGKPLPEDALVGPGGARSGDPHTLYGPYEVHGPRNYRNGKGAIRAFGEHKGSGLAFMMELLGGSLTGTGAAQEGRRWANGMMSIYIDPKRIDPEGFFPSDVARYVTYFKSSAPETPGGEVLAPGEPEIRNRKKRLAEGIPLPDDTWAMLANAAREVGLDDARIESARG